LSDIINKEEETIITIIVICNDLENEKSEKNLFIPTDTSVKITGITGTKNLCTGKLSPPIKIMYDTNIVRINNK
jgi:hypothetical protein